MKLFLIHQIILILLYILIRYNIIYKSEFTQQVPLEKHENLLQKCESLSVCENNSSNAELALSIKYKDIKECQNVLLIM